MGRILLGALMLFVSIPAAAGTNDKAAAAAEPDLAGRYACEGVSPEGQPYHGIVDIVRLDDTFRVIWTLAGDGGEVQQVMGVGILSNGIFAASYFGGGPGVAVYRIDGTRLVGEWTIGGADGTMYPETLTRMKDQDQKDEDAPHVRPHEDEHPATRQPASFREAALR